VVRVVAVPVDTVVAVVVVVAVDAKESGAEDGCVVEFSEVGDVTATCVTVFDGDAVSLDPVVCVFKRVAGFA
jgi:hypothetical protein